MWGRLKTFDPLLYLIPLVLCVVSVIFIYILTLDQVGASLAIRQGIVALVGLVAMVLLTFLDYRSLKPWAYWIFGGMLLTLIAVRLVGVTQFGATSWINLGSFQFQPGEFAKLLVTIVLAAFLSMRGKVVSNGQFLRSTVLFLVPVALILMQPDFGTALCVAVIGVTVILQARLSILQRVVVWTMIGLVALSLVLSFKSVQPFDHLLKPYQKDRLASFIDPSRDPGGSGYNVQQSKIAVGSGGLLGKSLGFGSQSQLNFLPVVQSDFIFAAIAEAWGMAGSYGLITLFGLLIFRLIKAGQIAQDEFGCLICLGMAALMLFQLLINVGMNIGVMPVTGIPLPFLSYGGTALVTYCMGLGIAQSVVVRSKRLTF